MEYILLDLIKHAEMLPPEQQEKQMKHILHLTEMIDIIMSGPIEASENTEIEPLEELRRMTNAKKEEKKNNNTIIETLMRTVKLNYAKKKLQQYKFK
jgi:hypothetical protein